MPIMPVDPVDAFLGDGTPAAPQASPAPVTPPAAPTAPVDPVDAFLAAPAAAAAPVAGDGFDPDKFLSAVGLGNQPAAPKYPVPTGHLANPISTGLAQGIANLAALPGTAIALAGNPHLYSSIMGGPLNPFGLANLGALGATSLAGKAVSALTGKPAPEPMDLQGLGQAAAAAPAQIMRDPRVSMLPQDPNWRPPSAGGRFVQNLTSYIPAALTMQPELIAGKGIMGALASNVGAATGQTVAEEVAPNNGNASVLAALIGGLTPAAAVRLPAVAAGIGAKLAGERAPQVAAGLNAYKDAVFQGGGPIASRTAFAPAYEQEGVNQILKKAAALDPRAGTDAATFGPQATPAQQAGLNILATTDQVPTDNGFSPLTAGVTDNSGVKTLVGGIGKQNPAVMQAVTEGNQGAVSQGLADATAPAGVTPATPNGTPPTAASDFFAQRFNGRQAADRVAVATADQAAQDVAATPFQGQGDIEGATGTSAQAAAATDVRDSLNQNRAAAKDGVNQAYASVPDTTPITTSNTAQAIKDAQAAIGENESNHPLVDKMAGNRVGGLSASDQKAVDVLTTGKMAMSQDQAIAALGIKDGGSKSISLFQARSDLRALNDAIAEETLPNGNLTKKGGRLVVIKKALNADLDATADQSGNEALKSANAKYRDYAETFKDNEAGKALGDRTAPENTTSTFTQGSSPQRGTAQLAKGLGDSPAGAAGVRADFLGRLGKNGAPNSTQIAQFLKENGSALEAFPAIRREIEVMGTNAANKEGAVSEASTTAAQAKEGAAATVAEQAAHPAAPFVEGANTGYLGGKTPQQAAASVFTGEGSATAKMKALVALAKKDTTGKALEGLRNAVSEHLNTRMRNASQVGADLGSASPLTSNRNPSQAKLGKTLETTGEVDSDTRSALSQLYTPEEMQKFDMVHKQNRATINSTAKNTGANSTTNQEDEANKSIIRMLGESGGKTGLIAKVLKKAFPGGDFEEARQAARTAILTNPRAAAAGLLRPNSPQSITKISDLLKANVSQLPSKLAPAISTGAESQEKAGEKANPRPITPTTDQPINPPSKLKMQLAEEPQEEVRKALPANAPFDAAAHVMKNEGVTTNQDGRKEYYGFRSGDGTGYNEIRKLVLQKGADSPEVKNLVSNLLAARASRAGVDQFGDPGTQAALTTMAHMRGEAGARAIMAAVGGQPLYKRLGTIPQKSVDAINQMSPADFQNKLQAARENYDRQFYWSTPSSVTTNGRTRTGSFGNLYGKGLLDRYSRERNDFLALSNQQA